MTHGVNGHETAAYIMQTGRRPGDGEDSARLPLVRRGRRRRSTGYDDGYKGDDPALRRADAAAGPLRRRRASSASRTSRS